MPELPEVETIRTQLSSVLVGKTIKEVEVRKAKIFRGRRQSLIGKKVTGLRRYSKLLVIDLNSGLSLVIHLKMTGRLVFENRKKDWDVDYSTDKHTHVVITFTSGERLYFHDLRQFGYLQIVSSQAVGDLPYVKSLGPECLKDLTGQQFKKIMQGSRRPVKLVLIDQKKLAGVGNIYANESLWCAQLHPQTAAGKLTEDQIVKLFQCLEKILKQAIGWRGASDNSYRDAFGAKGQVQKHFLVYNREGQPCLRCQTSLKKFSLGGRGTYFCPHCQRY